MYEYIERHTGEYSTKTMCKVLSVSRSGYYGYVSGKSQRNGDKETSSRQVVSDIFREHKRRYGSRRIYKELQRRGGRIGLHRVRRLMKAEGLVAIQPKRVV